MNLLDRILAILEPGPDNGGYTYKDQMTIVKGMIKSHMSLVPEKLKKDEEEKMKAFDEGYSKGFKAGRAMKKNDGKNAFEAGVEKGKRDTEKKNEREINHLQSALSQAGKNYFDVAEQRDIAYARGYQEAKNNIAKLQQEELGEHFKNGYDKGYKDSANRFSTHEETYQNGRRDGIRIGWKDGKTEGLKEGRAELTTAWNNGYIEGRSDGEGKAKKEYAAEVLKLTYKSEQALEVKWREGFRVGKATADKAIAEAHANGLREGKMQKVHAIVDEARSQGYQNGLKDGYYNGLQAAAKAVDTKILAATHKEPTLGGIPEGSQVVVDTSNWDMRERVRK